MSVAVVGSTAIGASRVAGAATNLRPPGAAQAAMTLGATGAARAVTTSATLASPGSHVGIYAGPVNTAAVAHDGSLLGHRVRWAMDFLDPTSWAKMSDPSWFLGRWKGTGYRMVWGVPMLPNSGGYTLAEGATGMFNIYFKKVAEAFVAAGRGRAIIRLGWEFNGSWFPWAANHHAASFVEYWRKIVNTMRSVRGQHFQFEWNPTRSDLGVGPLSQYYPGDRYVDIIGLDVYDTEWGRYPGAVAEWSHMVHQTDGLQWQVDFGREHHKLLAFPEWGLGWNSGGMVSGGDNGYFVAHIASWVAHHNFVNAVAWDYGSNPLPTRSAPVAMSAFVKNFSR